MNEVYLFQELEKLVASAIKDFRLKTKSGELKLPDIYFEHLPITGEEAFPFVLIKFQNSQSNPQMGTVCEVSISVGCYDSTIDDHDKLAGCYADALIDCFNVASAIRTALLSLEDSILASRYIRIDDVSLTAPDEQSWPQFQLDIMTKWQFHAPSPLSKGREYGY